VCGFLALLVVLVDWRLLCSRKKQLKKHPPVVQHFPGSIHMPQVGLSFKRLILKLVIIEMDCLYIDNLLFSKLAKPTTLGVTDLRFSFRLVGAQCSRGCPKSIILEISSVWYSLSKLKYVYAMT
jgi:hypothetical protein